MNYVLVNELAGYARRLEAAQTREEVGLIYTQMVGYDSAADDPEATLDTLRADALDYVKEVCVAHGIPCGIVGLAPE
jgi:adenylosuccinate synthase